MFCPSLSRDVRRVWLRLRFLHLGPLQHSQPSRCRHFHGSGMRTLRNLHRPRRPRRPHHRHGHHAIAPRLPLPWVPWVPWASWKTCKHCKRPHVVYIGPDKRQVYRATTVNLTGFWPNMTKRDPSLARTGLSSHLALAEQEWTRLPVDMASFNWSESWSWCRQDWTQDARLFKCRDYFLTWLKSIPYQLELGKPHFIVENISLRKCVRIQ